MRVIKAMFFSILTVVLVYLVIMLLNGDLNNYFICAAIFLAIIIAFLGMLFVAIPTHFIFMKLNIRRAFAYISVGFIMPAISVWITHPFGEDGFWWIVWQGSLLGGFGALSAFVFWVFAVQLATSIDEQK